MQGFSKDFQYKILSMDFEERSDDLLKEISFNHFQSDIFSQISIQQNLLLKSPLKI